MDEQKAEFRTREKYCKKCNLKECSKTKNNSCFAMHTNDYLDGLAEGKKETKDYYHKKLTTEYAKHNEEISELKKLYNNEKNKYAECLTECLCLRDEVAELKAQIEKMKCCRNCLYENNDEELVKEMKNNQCPCTDCKKLNYKNWRLYK